MKKKNPTTKTNTSIKIAIANAIEDDPDIILLAYGVDIAKLKVRLERNIMDYLAQVITVAGLKAQGVNPNAKKIVVAMATKLGFKMNWLEE